jgi:hypothetical protein
MLLDSGTFCEQSVHLMLFVGTERAATDAAAPREERMANERIFGNGKVKMG